MRRVFAFVLAFLLPLQAMAAASRLTASYKKINDNIYQPIRCVDGLAGGSASPEAGEDCEVGDWSVAIPASGAKYLKVWYRVESGTSNISVWDCAPFYGTAFPGDNPRPSLTDTASGTNPLCVNLTAGAGVSAFDGKDTGVQFFSLYRPNGGFSNIVIELDTESTVTSTMRVEVGN
jgi:hypothetical protein